MARVALLHLLDVPLELQEDVTAGDHDALVDSGQAVHLSAVHVEAGPGQLLRHLRASPAPLPGRPWPGGPGELVAAVRLLLNVQGYDCIPLLQVPRAAPLRAGLGALLLQVQGRAPPPHSEGEVHLRPDRPPLQVPPPRGRLLVAGRHHGRLLPSVLAPPRAGPGAAALAAGARAEAVGAVGDEHQPHHPGRP